MSIKVLDSVVVNRIAAGEVVQNPASVIKELLDNAIDANATKITVTIVNGGIDLMSVSDNGTGIAENELELAFLPHSTSKIESADDLNEIKTLGFRGEALASIVAVSKTTAQSKQKHSEYGRQIIIEGGNITQNTETGITDGTTIKVENLFYNTPARLKFLKKPSQEEAEITNIIARYILSNPQISFKYFIDNKLFYQSNGSGLVNAISSVYRADTTQNILKVEDSFGTLKISGYVSKLGFYKPNSLYQTLIVNGRYIIDPLVSKAVFTAYEDYLMTRQYPFYVLNISLDYYDVDVNTHPGKLNIKFAHPNIIFDFVLSSVKKVIYNFINQPLNENKTLPAQNLDQSKPKIEPNAVFETQLNKNLIEVELTANKNIPVNIDNQILSLKSSEKIFNEYTQNAEKLNLFDKPQSETPNQTYTIIENFSDVKIVGAIYDEFLLLQKADKFIMMDIHAAHERLIYDDFLSKLKNHKLAVQDLLVPFIKTLTALEVNFVLQFKNELSEMGFVIDQFGNNDIKISTVPVLYKTLNLNAFIDDLVADTKTFRPKFNKELHDYIALKACKNAVKAGQTLTKSEVENLLKDINFNKPTLLCPHGRPVVVVISKTQIEKWFKRIV